MEKVKLHLIDLRNDHVASIILPTSDNIPNELERLFGRPARDLELEICDTEISSGKSSVLCEAISDERFLGAKSLMLANDLAYIYSVSDLSPDQLEILTLTYKSTDSKGIEALGNVLMQLDSLATLELPQYAQESGHCGWESDEKRLGYAIFETSPKWEAGRQLCDKIGDYFDYEAIGRDEAINYHVIVGKNTVIYPQSLKENLFTAQDIHDLARQLRIISRKTKIEKAQDITFGK
jgi:hypothetical protein